MMEIERPKIETAALSPDGRYGKFVVEPLERGFGTTLGNSLRRVLLSLCPVWLSPASRLTAWCMSFPPLRACARMSPRSS